MLAVLIALTAIVGVPSAFAEIEVGNYGFTQMKNANLAFNTALDQFLVKIVEMANAINDNTAAITELESSTIPYGNQTFYQQFDFMFISNAQPFETEFLVYCNAGDIITGGGHKLSPGLKDEWKSGNLLVGEQRTGLLDNFGKPAGLGYTVATNEEILGSHQITVWALCVDTTP